MAERRMFAKKVIDSDLFLEMPLATQALYFHLAMRADDDGFVNNPKKIVRMIGADETSLKILISNSFLIPFNTGIVVISHWKLHNFIRKDRYKPTIYQNEKNNLMLQDNGVYEILYSNCVQEVDKRLTEGIPMVDQWDTQVSIGKVSIGKDSIEHVIVVDPKNEEEQQLQQTVIEPEELKTEPEEEKPKRKKFVKPTIDEIKQYCIERKNKINAAHFFDYYESKGWIVGKTSMKDWKAAIRTWERQDFNQVTEKKEGANNGQSNISRYDKSVGWC